MGDTLGDTVSPSCIPQIACKFPRKYKALADRSANRINPDSPLGAPPLKLPISPSVADSNFRRFNVPSQISTHHHGFQPDGCCRFVGTLLARIKFGPRTLRMEDKERRNESLVVDLENEIVILRETISRSISRKKFNESFGILIFTSLQFLKFWILRI
jgi:hypothetical protein